MTQDISSVDADKTPEVRAELCSWPVRYAVAEGITDFVAPREPRGLPSSCGKPSSAENVTIRVDQGLLFDAQRQVIGDTAYMVGERVFPTAIYRKVSFPQTARVRIAYNAGWRNYYHTLVQGLHSLWLFETNWNSPDWIYLHPEPSLPYRDFLSALRFPLKRFSFVHKAASLSLPEAAWMPTSYARGTSPYLRSFSDDLLVRARVSDAKPNKIYVSRGDSARRRMTNERDVEGRLSSIGFEVVKLTGLPLVEQIRLFRSADVIVAPHGAGLSNVLFARPGTRVIELSNASDANTCFAAMGGELDLDYQIHVSPSPEVITARHDTEWTCDIDDLMRRLR